MNDDFSRRMISAVVFSLMVFSSGGWPPSAQAADEKDAKPSIIRMIKERASADIRLLTYGVIQEPARSSQNPDNNFLQLPHYTADLELRPDVRLDGNILELSAKPRAKLALRIWEEGSLSGRTCWKDEWYVNEWMMRLKVRENLLISYGRENLQWGPSFLFSPSNPFFRDNGRSNPYMEVAGMDFSRLVWIPRNSWAMSLIVNTDEGRNKLIGPETFENTYALKVDYMEREYYASVVFSRKAHKHTLGLFGGWTVSDAILLYGEGSFMQGSNALYPRNDGSYLGASMQKVHREDSGMKPIILIGTSYTLESSGTFSLEYVYNAEGYSREEADIYYELRRKGAMAFNMQEMAGVLGKMTLWQTIDPGLRLLRKNFAMLQYTQSNIVNKIDLTVRWTQNFDDGSGQFLSLLSCSLGDHLELFSSGMVHAGGQNTEFGSIMNYQFMFGIKYTF